MDCENYEALAVDLLYGEISPERRADADAHATTCAECGKLSKELDEARKTAASLPARIAPPPELDERIMLAARMASDVRRQPLRGSMLHVAAAAVLGALLIGVSFVAGMNVHPKTVVSGPYDDMASNPKKNDPGSTLVSDHTDSATPRIAPNLHGKEWRDYVENLLVIANEDLARGEFKRALTEFGGVFSGGGRTLPAVEARVGMAKCLRGLARLEEARACAKDAFSKNDEWGWHDEVVDKDCMQLVNELNDKLQKR